MENLTVLNFVVGVKRFKTSEKSYTIDITLNVSKLTDADIVGWLKNSSSPKVWVQAKLRKMTNMQLDALVTTGYTTDLPRAGAKSGFGKVIDWKKVLIDIFGNEEKAEKAANKFGGYHVAAIELAKFMDIALPEDEDDMDEDDMDEEETEE